MITLQETLKRLIQEELAVLLSEQSREWVNVDQMFIEEGVTISLNRPGQTPGHGRVNFRDVNLHSETPVDQISTIVKAAIDEAIRQARAS